MFFRFAQIAKSFAQSVQSSQLQKCILSICQLKKSSFSARIRLEPIYIFFFGGVHITYCMQLKNGLVVNRVWMLPNLMWLLGGPLFTMQCCFRCINRWLGRRFPIVCVCLCVMRWPNILACTAALWNEPFPLFCFTCPLKF